jgi:hypothetical protein
MSFKETIINYSENHMKRTITLRVRNEELLNQVVLTIAIRL